jgi:hypothetical protein
MSKKFQYKGGYTGIVSDSVATILEKKGEGKIVKDTPPPAPPGLSKKEREELIKKAVKLELGNGDDLAKLSDESLQALLKDK